MHQYRDEMLMRQVRCSVVCFRYVSQQDHPDQNRINLYYFNHIFYVMRDLYF